MEKGTNIDTESCGRFVEREPWKRSFMHGQAGIRLNLIRQMAFVIKSRLVQDWILFFSLLREQFS